jgi:hypothetical protein
VEENVCKSSLSVVQTGLKAYDSIPAERGKLDYARESF